MNVGVFYKLAEADGKIITNIEYASKIAGHELKGCSSYYNTSVKGLSFPLIACIDYRGFRLIGKQFFLLFFLILNLLFSFDLNIIFKMFILKFSDDNPSNQQ